VTLPTGADSYEFRLFLNDGYTRAATSSPVVLTTTLRSRAPAHPQNYSYDAVGNRLAGAGATYTVAGGSNRLQSISGTLIRSYGYDNSGNVTSDGTRTFSYNDAGRMTSVMKASVTTTYALNALGQRVKKTTSGTFDLLRL
jgi:YD repeat-containing protein